jgi:uncharacterized phage infection (PIP) family protein YhgE
MDSQDPFHWSQSEVRIGISELSSMLANRDDILSDHRGGSMVQFETLGEKMRGSIMELRGLLSDLSESLNKIRGNKELVQIDSNGLKEREDFVDDFRVRLNEIEEEMNRQSPENVQKRLFEPTEASYGLTRTLELEEYQKERLEGIHKVVSKQKAIGNEINYVLDEHKRVIRDLDSEVDEAETSMKSVTKQISEIIEREGKAPCFFVVVLSMILIILLFVIA